MLKILFAFGLQKIFNISIARWDTFTNSKKNHINHNSSSYFEIQTQIFLLIFWARLWVWVSSYIYEKRIKRSLRGTKSTRQLTYRPGKCSGESTKLSPFCSGASPRLFYETAIVKALHYASIQGAEACARNPWLTRIQGTRDRHEAQRRTHAQATKNKSKPMWRDKQLNFWSNYNYLIVHFFHFARHKLKNLMFCSMKILGPSTYTRAIGYILKFPLPAMRSSTSSAR